ncbi:hypothetical protein B0D78_03425 [Pyramidobacter sp. C12-8]|nr:hypothetical protein B0D78_03425 [Pyramidobacter sp. C12-8]
MTAGKFFVIFRADRLPFVFFEFELVAANYKYITRRCEYSSQEQRSRVENLIRRFPAKTFTRSRVEAADIHLDNFVGDIRDVLPLEKYSLKSPLAFSFVPLCHG